MRWKTTSTKNKNIHNKSEIYETRANDKILSKQAGQQMNGRQLAQERPREKAKHQEQNCSYFLERKKQ